MKGRILLVLGITILVLLLLMLLEILVIKYNAGPVPAPKIPRETKSLGKGPKLSYVIMGDSTAIGQGTDYKNSFAVSSAEHLAKNYSVKFVNVGVSGAKTKDVLDKQLEQAEVYKPDVVLLAVGANDARHFIRGKITRTSLQKIVDGLKQSNCNVRIVVTRSPAVDAVNRFPWPAKQLMGLRTKQVNAAFEPVIKQNNLTVAPIAEKTRAAFLADPTLLAADKFHPNNRGYALWKPVINNALDQALAKPVPANCQKTDQ